MRHDNDRQARAPAARQAEPADRARAGEPHYRLIGCSILFLFSAAMWAAIIWLVLRLYR